MRGNGHWYYTIGSNRYRLTITLRRFIRFADAAAWSFPLASEGDTRPCNPLDCPLISIPKGGKMRDPKVRLIATWALIADGDGGASGAREGGIWKGMAMGIDRN